MNRASSSERKSRRWLLGCLGIVLLSALCFGLGVAGLIWGLRPAQARVERPLVEIRTPEEGALLSAGEPVTVEAWAQAGQGRNVVSLILWEDARRVGRASGHDSVLAHAFTWTPSAPGSHTLTVVAYDDLGTVNAARVYVEVVAEDDEDNDGVPNAADACPETFGDPAAAGCPLPAPDLDGDSVPEGADRCPTTAGTAEGCPEPGPGDADGDGLPDAEDRCPATPGSDRTGGCPLPGGPRPGSDGTLAGGEDGRVLGDRDGDGVPDEEDLCPDEPGVPAGIDLPGASLGCPPPPDRDGDGLPDWEDRCPDEPEDPEMPGPEPGCPPPTGRDEGLDPDGDGIVEGDVCPERPGPAIDPYNGCPPEAGPDRDGDGVPDAFDFCLNDPGGWDVPFDYAGCPADFVMPCPAPLAHPAANWDTDGDGTTDDCDPDDDNDGIPDVTDLCPYTPGAGVAGAFGCHPLLPGEEDHDGDGVPNRVDRCPLHPGSDDWRSRGCPAPPGEEELNRDDDGDGTSNRLDLCPDRPGEHLGCPPAADSDGDGLNDWEDDCPEAWGPFFTGGCPLEIPEEIADDLFRRPPLCRFVDCESLLERRDGDRPKPAAPAHPCEDLAFPEDIFCRLSDDDGDGVLNGSDACPNKVGLWSLNGCPDDQALRQACPVRARRPGDPPLEPRPWCPEAMVSAEPAGPVPMANLEIRLSEHLATDHEWDGVFCYASVAAAGVPPVRLPFDENYLEGDGTLWSLGGPERRSLRITVPAIRPLGLRMRCYGVIGGILWSTLGDIALEVPPERWDGVERVAVSSGGEGRFTVAYRICRETCEGAGDRPPDEVTYTEVGRHPTDRELSGEGADSEAAQGIAFSGTHWFYSNQEAVYRLSRDFQRADRRFSGEELAGPLGGVECGHIGGIDFYEGELYLALEGCDDERARIIVLDSELHLLRYARLPREGIPWVAVDPVTGHLYTEEYCCGLIGFPRRFDNGEELPIVDRVRLHPFPRMERGDDYWAQGGDFSPDGGLFFLTVDDATDERADHTGVWVYRMERGDDAVGRRVGLINIKYDPDIFGYRSDELEDLDASPVDAGPTQGDLHVLLLSNELGEDDVTVIHYRLSAEGGSRGAPLSAFDRDPAVPDIVERWAPVIYQDVDADNLAHDLITAVDFDGNWRGADNAANAPSYPLPAVVYYSKVETSTHAFLGYYFYHAASYDETSLGTFFGHEHDLEGAVLAVNNRTGWPEALLTNVHGPYVPYVGPDTPDVRARRQHPDGYRDQPGFTMLPRLLDPSDPSSRYDALAVGVEANTHAVWGRWNTNCVIGPSGSGACDDSHGGDGLIYVYKGRSEVPRVFNRYPDWVEVGYRLVDIQDLWQRAWEPDACGQDEPSALFACQEERPWDKFNSSGEDAGDLPWVWGVERVLDHTCDGPDILLEPAEVFLQWFVFPPGTFSTTYVDQPYRLRVPCL